MGIAGLIFSLLAAGFMIIGLVPFLGWLNWLTTLPLAIIGVVFSSVGLARSRGGIAAAGLAISIIVLVITVGRLYISLRFGGGII